MLPKIIDNNRFSLNSVIEEISPKYKHLSIATGYWDLLGTELIFNSIKKYEKVRLLIGREPLIPRHKRETPEPDYPDEDFFRDLESLEPDPKLKALIQEIKNLIERKALEVKVYKKSFFHAKSYIFGNYESENAIGIIGSSNFTKNGLTRNTELNALESDHRIVTFQPKTKEQEVGHLFWFDQFWNSEYAEEWSGKFSEIISESPVGDTLFSPYETYIKTLYELYKEELEDEKLKNNFSSTHDLLDFQIKNAQSLLRRLKKYGTALLSDSVGLGKTYTAIEVIKQYLDTDEGRKRVEIICPKSLQEQWRQELTTQGVLNLEPITLQNLDAVEKKQNLDSIANVSLFVIDESHNLKNRGGKRFDKIVSWIRNNPKSHVLMLTATPISNQLTDISNQLLLGTGGEANVLMLTSTDKKTNQTTSINFHQAIENLQKKTKADLKRNGKIDESYIKERMSPILRAFIVRRTRQGIEKEYGGLIIDGKKYTFPEVKPYIEKYNYNQETANNMVVGAENNKYFNVSDIYKIPINSIVDNTKKLVHPVDNINNMSKEISDESVSKKSPIYLMYQTILFLNFIPYKWRTYKKEFYGKTKEELRDLGLDPDESKKLFLQTSIYGILRTMFLKRIESSTEAFEKSLVTYERKLEVFKQGLLGNKIISIKNLDNLEQKLGIGEDDIDPEDLNELEEEEVLDDSVSEETYCVEALLEDIEKEKVLLSLLKKKINLLRKDNSKVESFIKLVEKVRQEDSNKKILIFSYYADTINFLKEKFSNIDSSPVNEKNAGFLSSKNRKEAESLACRFSPKSKNYQLQKDESELQYLFSTDILSEGQNLQDCGVVINYDLHWNPTRMIQRNGRINRLGTPFKEVYTYNISPEKQLEEYLKLIHKLESKIKLIRSTIGTDTPVLDESENPLEFTDTLQDVYSEDLQKRIQAINNSELESDFLLAEDEYISDLKLFHNNKNLDPLYRKKVYGIPLGKWCAMPSIDFRGKNRSPRPALLSFSELFDKKKNSLGHTFVSTNAQGEDIEFITDLQALEWLRTAKKDNKKLLDKISLNKGKIKTIISQASKVYSSQDESSPEPQQQQVLRILYDARFSEKQINSVRDSFRTSNILDKQEIKFLCRKIIQASKQQKTDLDSIRKLLSISEKTSIEENQVKVEETKQVLFYVRNND